MNKLNRIEDKYRILLPLVYRDFYDSCSLSIPAKLVGTSLLNQYSYFYFIEGATDLLEDDGIENFLENDDFIFMMHQGYMFWYFKADGNPDPVVYGYYEGKGKREEFGAFSLFAKEYME